MKQDICQSCGMPLENEEDYGTESDDSLNTDYCRYCFQEGNFTDEGITLQEKIEKNVDLAVGMGMNPEKAREMAEAILPNLERWKVNS